MSSLTRDDGYAGIPIDTPDGCYVCTPSIIFSSFWLTGGGGERQSIDLSLLVRNTFFGELKRSRSGEPQSAHFRFPTIRIDGKRIHRDVSCRVLRTGYVSMISKGFLQDVETLSRFVHAQLAPHVCRSGPWATMEVSHASSLPQDVLMLHFNAILRPQSSSPLKWKLRELRETLLAATTAQHEKKRDRSEAVEDAGRASGVTEPQEHGVGSDHPIVEASASYPNLFSTFHSTNAANIFSVGDVSDTLWSPQPAMSVASPSVESMSDSHRLSASIRVLPSRDEGRELRLAITLHDDGPMIILALFVNGTIRVIKARDVASVASAMQSVGALLQSLSKT